MERLQLLLILFLAMQSNAAFGEERVPEPFKLCKELNQKHLGVKCSIRVLWPPDDEEKSTLSLKFNFGQHERECRKACEKAALEFCQFVVKLGVDPTQAEVFKETVGLVAGPGFSGPGMPCKKLVDEKGDRRP